MKPLKTKARLRSVSKKKAREDRKLIGVKAEVVKRSGGWCEARFSSRCRGMASTFHHRKQRALGGKHTEENVMHVCEVPCHAEIHCYIEEAHALGLLVHSWEDPADIPIKRPA